MGSTFSLKILYDGKEKTFKFSTENYNVEVHINNVDHSVYISGNDQSKEKAITAIGNFLLSIDVIEEVTISLNVNNKTSVNLYNDKLVYEVHRICYNLSDLSSGDKAILFYRDKVVK